MELAERAKAIAAEARARAPKRAANREADPQFAAFIDALRAMDPGCELVRVIWPNGKVWEKRR